MTYEEYLDDLLGKASARTTQYDAERQQRADSSIQQVQNMYDTMDRAAVAQYKQSAEETADSYREAYDANAVSELTSRRRAEEAIANSNLANSGLNNTQQTAISLSRSRADAQVTRQKQAAVDAIMRELDSVRAQYRTEAAGKTATIQNEADADKATYWTKQQETAQEQAYDLYRFDREQAFEQYQFEQEQAQKALELRYKYGADDEDKEAFTWPHVVDTDHNRSYTAAKADTVHMAKTKGQKAAVDFIERLYVNGEITEEQRADLRVLIGARETEPISDGQLVSYMMRIYYSDGEQAAYSYLEELQKAGAITYDKYADMCKVVSAAAHENKVNKAKQEQQEQAG